LAIFNTIFFKLVVAYFFGPPCSVASVLHFDGKFCLFDRFSMRFNANSEVAYFLGHPIAYNPDTV